MKKSFLGTFITFFLALVFIIGGLSAVAFLASTSTMECKRQPENRGICTINTTTILNNTEKVIMIKELFKASVKKQGKLRKATFNIVLDTAIGEMDFLPSYIRQNEGLYDIKDQINNFIDNKESKTLLVKKDQKLFAYIFGGSFIFFGFILMCISSVSLLKRSSNHTRSYNSPIRYK